MKTKCKTKRNLKQKQKQKLTTINTGFNLPYSEHMGIFNTSNRVFNQIQWKRNRLVYRVIKKQITKAKYTETQPKNKNKNKKHKCEYENQKNK